VTLAIEALSVRYRALQALRDISLRVDRGRTLAIVGPSGAGKTTLLRSVAGLIEPDAGSVRLGQRDLTRVLPRDRSIALVFQDDALVPTMTLRQNWEFALRTRRDAALRIAEMGRAFGLASMLDRRPAGLSGGERQRGSIARALLSSPSALLLDEPLAHLDPMLRASLRDEVAGLRARFDGPILYVTHDHAEAMSVGDELAVLIAGRIEDSGSPQRVYDRPATLGVARVLGMRPMNIFDRGAIDGVPEGQVAGIRPEAIHVAADGAIRGRVLRSESTGPDLYLRVALERCEIFVRAASHESIAAGDAIALDFPADAMRYFDASTGKAIA
jgi:ABC-type sugar transport system ATPase subunit